MEDDLIINDYAFDYASRDQNKKLRRIVVSQCSEGWWNMLVAGNPNFLITSSANFTFSEDDLEEVQLIKKALDYMENRIKNFKERTLECPFCGGVMKEIWNQRNWFKCSNLPKCHTFRHEEEIRELLNQKGK